jgi:MFS family permease
MAATDATEARAQGGDHGSPALFRRLWAAAGLANLGDGVGLIAAPLLAATLTRDPVLIGGLTATQFLPYLLLGVPAGVLVDRVERRTAMIAANLVRAAALAGLCAGMVGGVVTIAWLYALGLLLGAAECVYDAAAEGAVPRLVGAERLDGANARLQGTVQVANNFVGAPLGALLFSAAAVAPFGVHAVLLVLATLLVASLPRLSSPRRLAISAGSGVAGETRETGGRRRRVRDDVLEGLGWLARHRTLRTLAFVSAGCAFANQLAQSTLVLFALEVLRIPEATFGLFAMAAAVGAVTGTTVAPATARRFGRVPVMLTAAVVETVMLAAIGFAPGAVPAAVAFAVFAGAVGAWNVLSMSLRQQLVPENLFGRVHGAWRALVWGALPVGSWLGGVIAAQAGLRAPWFVGAGLYVVVVAFAFPALRGASELDDAGVSDAAAAPVA